MPSYALFLSVDTMACGAGGLYASELSTPTSLWCLPHLRAQNLAHENYEKSKSLRLSKNVFKKHLLISVRSIEFVYAFISTQRMQYIGIKYLKISIIAHY